MHQTFDILLSARIKLCAAALEAERDRCSTDAALQIDEVGDRSEGNVLVGAEACGRIGSHRPRPGSLSVVALEFDRLVDKAAIGDDPLRLIRQCVAQQVSNSLLSRCPNCVEVEAAR